MLVERASFWGLLLGRLFLGLFFFFGGGVCFCFSFFFGGGAVLVEPRGSFWADLVVEHTVDEIHCAPQKPWLLMISCTYQRRMFPMVSKWCRISSINSTVRPFVGAVLGLFLRLFFLGAVFGAVFSPFWLFWGCFWFLLGLTWL